MKGDVVLLLDDKNKISNLSRIVDIVKSGDKTVRAVKVIHGINREATWWPVRKVSFLEVGDPKSIPNKFSDKTSPEHVNIPIRKSSRKASKRKLQ